MRPDRDRWRRRALRWGWWAAQILVGTVLGLLLFDRVIMPRVVRQGAEVDVPEVTERPIAEAVALLEDAGLRPEITEGKFSPTVSGGLVLSASPDGGLRVKKGRQVFLTPSLGVESRAVPELTGATLRIAQTKLRTLGLDVGQIRYAAVGDIAEGAVLASSPGPGSSVPADGKVDLLLSKEKAAIPLRMPELSGRAAVETAAWLQSCGFTVAIEETSFPGDAGEIVRHEPLAGAAVYPGAKILLVMAKGMEESDSDGEGWRERLSRRSPR